MLDRRKIVGHKERPQSRAADHDHLKRKGFKNRGKMAAVDDKSAEHHHKDDDDTDNSEHCRTLLNFLPAALQSRVKKD
jgi:hypothetical protein